MNLQHKIVIALATLVLLGIAVVPTLADPMALAECVDTQVQAYKETHGSLPTGANYDVIVYTCHMQIYGKDPRFYTPDKDAEIDPMGIPASDKTIYVGGPSEQLGGNDTIQIAGRVDVPGNNHNAGEKQQDSGMDTIDINGKILGNTSGNDKIVRTPPPAHNHTVITCPKCGEKMIVCPTCNTVIPLVTPTPQMNKGDSIDGKGGVDTIWIGPDSNKDK